MTSSPHTLPHHAQKAVVGRILGLEALAPYLSPLEYQGLRDAADRLVMRLCWLTNDALGDPDSGEQLDAFLARVTEALRQEAASLSTEARPAVSHALDDFSERVAEFCADPYDPLERLARAASEISHEFYQRYGENVPPEIWERTIPIFSFLGGKAALSFAADIHLNVRTKFTESNSLSAQVILQIVPRSLDAHTIAALPRTLLHEYIAHVPQGPYSGGRAHPDANDIFSEGWMDYVTHRVYRSILEHKKASEELEPLGEAARWTVLYEAAAEHFFATRCALRDGDPAAAARSEGAAAARQLHDLLRRLPETADDPDVFMYRISFGINGSSLSIVSRQRIAAEIRRCLLRASLAYALVPPLRDWASGKITLAELCDLLLGLAVRASDDV
jgi:hypothetical protein